MDENNLTEQEQKIIDLENNWKRALADYSNLQKRVVEEKSEIIKFANTTLLLRLLSIFDNLELVDKHSNDLGLKLVIKEFKQLLSEEGVEEIEALEQEFDSQKMEAIEMVEGKENTVVDVIQKGYLLKGKILRPARVAVGNGSQDSKEEN